MAFPEPQKAVRIPAQTLGETTLDRYLGVRAANVDLLNPNLDSLHWSSSVFSETPPPAPLKQGCAGGTADSHPDADEGWTCTSELPELQFGNSCSLLIVGKLHFNTAIVWLMFSLSEGHWKLRHRALTHHHVVTLQIRKKLNVRWPKTAGIGVWRESRKCLKHYLPHKFQDSDVLCPCKQDCRPNLLSTLYNDTSSFLRRLMYTTLRVTCRRTQMKNRPTQEHNLDAQNERENPG